MKPQPLDESELALVRGNHDDVVLLEILKGMSVDELRSFDVYAPMCMKHYMKIQESWIITEKSLLVWSCGRNIDESELINDMVKTRNPERFRAYYVMKFPGFVTRIAKDIDSSSIDCACGH